jgi:hypothetical protein
MQIAGMWAARAVTPAEFVVIQAEFVQPVDMVARAWAVMRVVRAALAEATLAASVAAVTAVAVDVNRVT